MNFLCDIVVSSFVFFLSYFFTSACYVLHNFTFFPTQSTQQAFTGLIDVVLDIVCPDCLLLCGTQQCFCSIATFFPYQLSPSFRWWIVRALVFYSTFLLVLLFLKFYTRYILSRINFLSCRYPYNKVFFRVSNIEP